MNEHAARTWWTSVGMAASVLMVTMGIRQVTGLFVSPINTSTGVGIVALSFALAVGQFVWGAVQPIAGAVADRYGPGRVLGAGIVLLALGTALAPFATTGLGLLVVLGVVSAAGSGASSFSVLIGAAAKRIPAEHRGTASGIVNAGGSFGQFVFAPVTQALISTMGWMNAMWALAVASLATLPLARGLRGAPAQHAAVDPSDRGLRHAVTSALSDRSYLLLHAGFFTCGFHIAFLVTHLPGEVALCGLPAAVASWSLGIIGLANIAGSLLAGWGVNRFRSKYILFWLYLSRAVLVVLYLVAPKTALTYYVFAAALGMTWLATVPPTAGVVAKLFGVRYLATLFGMTLMSHQIGGFFGAWLGGIAVSSQGSYLWMWYADALLALAAALVNLPIVEARVERRPVVRTAT